MNSTASWQIAGYWPLRPAIRKKSSWLRQRSRHEFTKVSGKKWGGGGFGRNAAAERRREVAAIGHFAVRDSCAAFTSVLAKLSMFLSTTKAVTASFNVCWNAAGAASP